MMVCVWWPMRLRSEEGEPDAGPVRFFSLPWRRLTAVASRADLRAEIGRTAAWVVEDFDLFEMNVMS